MPSNAQEVRLIAAPPALVKTRDVAVQAFLRELPQPDFDVVADQKALWSVQAAAGSEGTAAGSAYVVSAEALKYVKAHRY